MNEFFITSDDLSKEITSSNGDGSFILEPGWYMLKIEEVSPIATVDGISKGYISFADVDSGISFRYYTTYQVSLDKDKWRTQKTKNLIARILQCVGFQGNFGLNNLPTLVGKEVYANVDIVTRKGKSKTEVDEVGLPKEVEFKNNDFAKKGSWTEIILPAKPKQVPQAESDELQFKL